MPKPAREDHNRSDAEVREAQALPEALTVEEAAAALGVAPATIRHWCQHGTIPTLGEAGPGHVYHLSRRTVERLLQKDQCWNKQRDALRAETRAGPPDEAHAGI